MAEKARRYSAYNYVSDNPISRIDPDGMFDDYSLSDKGDVKLEKKTEDKTDRIVKTKSNGSVKKDGKGNSKTAIGGIEKGILKDGMNLKTNDNIIKVNGTNADGTKQATTAGVEDFALKLSNSNIVDKEIGGSYLSSGGQQPTAITLGGYANNTLTSNGPSGADLGIQNNLTLLGYFHTHPSDQAIQRDPYTASFEDKQIRDGVLMHNPNLYFILITNPSDGGNIPYRTDYTHDSQ